MSIYPQRKTAVYYGFGVFFQRWGCMVHEIPLSPLRPEKPPPKPSPDDGAFVTEKAAKDFERVYERQTGKRWDADHANDNEDNN